MLHMKIKFLANPHTTKQPLASVGNNSRVSILNPLIFPVLDLSRLGLFCLPNRIGQILIIKVETFTRQ